MGELHDAFIANVRRRMTELGWKQPQLADALGTTRAYVSQMLGKKINPTFAVAEKFAKALGVNVFWLLTPSEPMLAEKKPAKAIA